MSSLQIPLRKPRNNTFEGILHTLFNDIGIVFITQESKQKGIWKLGKTDFGLYLAQMLLKYQIVSRAATNINTFGYYPQICDLVSLKFWLHNRDTRPYRKVYVLDEINVHAPRRRAMSRKSVGLLQVIPEISKGKARLIIIGHELEKADSDLLTPGIVKGFFVKKTKKKAQLFSPLIEGVLEIPKIPATTIKFDPWEIAPFTERPKEEVMFKDQDLRLLYKWAKGETWKSLFKNPNECNRFVRRNVLKLLEKSFTDLQS